MNWQNPRKNYLCQWCKEPLPEKRRTVYCSETCRHKHANHKASSYNKAATLGLTGGVHGAIAESLVAIDLLKKNWNVYTAFEPTHPFDILATKNDKTIKIQVKTARFSSTGKQIKIKPKNNSHDILAIVVNMEIIEYTPKLPF